MQGKDEKKYLIVFPIQTVSEDELKEQIRLQTGVNFTSAILDLIIEQARIDGYLERNTIVNQDVPGYLRAREWRWITYTLPTGQRVSTREMIPVYYTGTEIVGAFRNFIRNTVRITGTDEDTAMMNAVSQYIELCLRHGLLERRRVRIDNTITYRYVVTSESGLFPLYYLVVYPPKAVSFIYVHTSVTTGVKESVTGEHRARSFEIHLECTVSVSCFNRITGGGEDWREVLMDWGSDVLGRWILCVDRSGEYYNLTYGKYVADQEDDIRGLQYFSISEEVQGKIRAEIYDKDYNRVPFESEIITNINWCIEYDTPEKLAGELCRRSISRITGKGGPKKPKPGVGRRRKYGERVEIPLISYDERKRRAIEEARRKIEGHAKGDLFDVLARMEGEEMTEKRA